MKLSASTSNSNDFNRTIKCRTLLNEIIDKYSDLKSCTHRQLSSFQLNININTFEKLNIEDETILWSNLTSLTDLIDKIQKLVLLFTNVSVDQSNTTDFDTISTNNNVSIIDEKTLISFEFCQTSILFLKIDY
jgi:hypothetical protein